MPLPCPAFLHEQLRSQGRDDLGSVRAAFLEPNGRVTFLFREAGQ
ncbi:MAG TPA: YetF domain-containing protein [Archangium sp.]|nr:YetF domain-containing protein [Archangium sp.]HEX5749039.1 YetF domain-containing protein [Archangium sp.]